MILAIDCGNSRVKWGLCSSPESPASSPIEWTARGDLSIEAVAGIADQWNFSIQPYAIMISNVAGGIVADRLAAALGRFEAAPRWISPGPSQGGVFNGYANPGQLGVDRWCALVGARALHPGNCLVVMAGTATTVDWLAASGEFRGGLILPGVQLMKRALSNHTAGLTYANGELVDLPRNTANGIETGCLLAQAGAIEKMQSRLPAGTVCLLSGGEAARIAGCLSVPHRMVDNLVLEGIVRMAPRFVGNCKGFP
jgi:type III pantothenate kinase